MPTTRLRTTVRFGLFELDMEAQELYRGSARIRLAKQPFDLLAALIEQPGKVVTREVLQQRLWTPDTFVDFDHGLNKTVRKLREALGDSAESPRYIETIQRIGYRFIAPVVQPGQRPVDQTPQRETSDAALHLTSTQAADIDRSDADRFTASALEQFPSPLVTTRWSIWKTVRIAATVVMLIAVMAWAFVHHAPNVEVASATSDPLKRLDASATSNGASGNADAAREEVRRGLFFLDQRNGVAGEAAFRHAVELDPRSSSAHAGLAQALVTQALMTPEASPETVALAEAEGRKAVALDPQNGDGYIALGTVQTTFTWEWQEAEQNLARGLQISPKNAVGNMWYAIHLQEAGRQDEAIQRIQVAVDAEPLSFFMLRQQASILYFARHYDEALRIIERAREMSPAKTAVLDNWVSWIDEQRGLYDDAVEHDLISLGNDSSARQIQQLRSAFRDGGWSAFWTARVDQMHPETLTGCRLYTAGKAYIHVGDKEQAFRYLQKAAEQHCFWLGEIFVDPGLDDLRHDSRFPSLVTLVDPKHQLSKAP